MRTIGFAFEADTYCVECTAGRFGTDNFTVLHERFEDREGNEIYPIQDIDESESCQHCGACNEPLDGTCSHPITRVKLGANGTIERDSDGTFPACVDGGYPVIYYTKSGATLCATCASKANKGDYDPLTGADIFYEGASENCDDCNKTIESAYGDPEEADRNVTTMYTVHSSSTSGVDPETTYDVAVANANRYCETWPLLTVWVEDSNGKRVWTHKPTFGDMLRGYRQLHRVLYKASHVVQVPGRSWHTTTFCRACQQARSELKRS